MYYKPYIGFVNAHSEGYRCYYHINFFKDMAEKYGIVDEAKALRVLADYALQDGDLDQIFHKKNMRCIACGGVV